MVNRYSTGGSSFSRRRSRQEFFLWQVLRQLLPPWWMSRRLIVLLNVIYLLNFFNSVTIHIYDMVIKESHQAWLIPHAQLRGQYT